MLAPEPWSNDAPIGLERGGVEGEEEVKLGTLELEVEEGSVAWWKTGGEGLCVPLAAKKSAWKFVQICLSANDQTKFFFQLNFKI